MGARRRGPSPSATRKPFVMRDSEVVTDPDCVSCDIACSRSPARFLYRDSSACAFLDVDPIRPGHSLVIPNAHVVDLMAEDAAAALTGMARALHVTADLLKRRLDADGISAFQSNGAAAGQTIAHLHFHLVPRHTGDARLTSNWSPSPDGAAGLEAMHELLK